MDILSGIDQLRDLVTVRRVYGKPIERDGVTVIPAAAVKGGGGGGTGGPGDAAHGAGWGLRARPVGAFVIRDGEVHWEPALDLSRVIVGGQIVTFVALFTLRTWLKSHRH